MIQQLQRLTDLIEESKSKDEKMLKLLPLSENVESPKYVDLIQPTLTESKFDDLKSPKTTKSEVKRINENYISRCNFIFLGVVFFMLLVISVVSFSTFCHNYRTIQTDTIYGTTNDYGSCILFASYDSSRSGPKVHLGNDWSCVFAITGQVLIAVYAFVSIPMVTIKMCGGWSVINIFPLNLELIAVILMMLLSFTSSIVISVGLSFTCQDLKDFYSKQNIGCEKYTVPIARESEDKGTVTFFKDIQTAETAAWLGFGILLGVSIFNVVCIIIYYYRESQAKSLKEDHEYND